MLRYRYTVACIAASFMGLTHSANASAAQITVYPNDSARHGYTYVELPHQPTVHLSMSDVTMGFLAITSTTLSAANPGYLTTSGSAPGEFTHTILNSPVSSMTGDYQQPFRPPTADEYPHFAVHQPSAFEATAIAAKAGFTLVHPNSRVTGEGGTLTLSNLHIDLTRQGIYADVQGTNQVGSLQGLRVWDFTTPAVLTVSTSPQSILTCLTTRILACADDTLSMSPMSSTALGLTPDGFEVFAQALGLNGFGVKALEASGKFFGTLSISPVPEPATWLTMGLGLVGIGLMRRRHQAAI